MCAVLAADDRGGFTNLRQLMGPVIDEMNDPEQDEMFSVSKDTMYNWKTLRVVARESLPAFAAAVRAGGDLKVAASILYPDEVPADMEEQEEKEELGEPEKAEQEGGDEEAKEEDVSAQEREENKNGDCGAEDKE